jgi:hypothetical protein
VKWLYPDLNPNPKRRARNPNPSLRSIGVTRPNLNLPILKKRIAAFDVAGRRRGRISILRTKERKRGGEGRDDIPVNQTQIQRWTWKIEGGEGNRLDRNRSLFFLPHPAPPGETKIGSRRIKRASRPFLEITRL